MTIHIKLYHNRSAPPMEKFPSIDFSKPESHEKHSVLVILLTISHGFAFLTGQLKAPAV